MRHAYNTAARVSNRGNGKRDVDQLAIFSAAHAFKVLDFLPTSDARENFIFFICAARREQYRHRPADRLSRAVAVDTVRGSIPRNDDSR
jgi:hypothetical protein